MKLLNVNEAAELTRLSVSSLYTYVCRKTIPYYKVGARVLFSEEELYTWIEEKAVKRVS